MKKSIILAMVFLLIVSINSFTQSYDTPKHPPVSHPNLIKLTPEQKQEFIDAHNKWRSEVGVPPLVWSNDLENYAGEWAIKNGKKNCILITAKIFIGHQVCILVLKQLLIRGAVKRMIIMMRLWENQKPLLDTIHKLFGVLLQK